VPRVRDPIGTEAPGPDTPQSLSLHVSLSAEDHEGRRIASAHSDFGMSGWRRGIWHRWHGPRLPDNPEEAERLVAFAHHVDLHDIEDGTPDKLLRIDLKQPRGVPLLSRIALYCYLVMWLMRSRAAGTLSSARAFSAARCPLSIAPSIQNDRNTDGAMSDPAKNTRPSGTFMMRGKA
jgi:hypothetical protein